MANSTSFKFNERVFYIFNSLLLIDCVASFIEIGMYPKTVNETLYITCSASTVFIAAFSIFVIARRNNPKWAYRVAYANRFYFVVSIIVTTSDAF